MLVCFEGIARLSRRVWRCFVRGSREISLVPSLHRASTDALITLYQAFHVPVHKMEDRHKDTGSQGGGLNGATSIL